MWSSPIRDRLTRPPLARAPMARRLCPMSRRRGVQPRGGSESQVPPSSLSQLVRPSVQQAGWGRTVDGTRQGATSPLRYATYGEARSKEWAGDEEGRAGQTRHCAMASGYLLPSLRVRGSPARMAGRTLRFSCH